MRNRRGKSNWFRLTVALIVVAVFFVGGYLLMNWWEQNYSMTADVTGDSGDEESETYIYLDGVAYTQKEHLTTMLLLGIDNTGEMQSSGSYVNDGQSDFIVVIVLDSDAGTYTLLQLNRDTMTDVQQLGIGGALADTQVMQLALAHTYGSGMEDSCENSVTAVENFLYGITVDHYIAINMSGVELLVDAMGGVTITIQDDFSNVDASLVEGETMTLNGSQCVTYIRSRKDVGEQTNISRMERQQQFIYELLDQLPDKVGEDSSLLTSAFADAASYMVTDYSATRLVDVFEEICDSECSGIYSPDGEAVEGDEYMEFYADDDSVKELVVSLFYDAVEE